MIIAKHLKTLIPVSDNTYTEEQIETPVGRSENVCMLIHGVNIQHDSLDANGEEISVQISRASKSSLTKLSDSDIIFKFEKVLNIDANGTFWLDITPKFSIFPPEFVANRYLYLGVRQIKGAAGNIVVDIIYSLHKATDQEILDALTD